MRHNEKVFKSKNNQISLATTKKIIINIIGFQKQNNATDTQKNRIHVTPVFLYGDVSKEPTSIVLISLDMVRADSLSIYDGRAEVPNLEKLARRSIVFSQAISHFSEQHFLIGQ